MERCVAYIDLLGFSHYVRKDHQNNDDAAAYMLQELIQLLRTKYGDSLPCPSSDLDGSVDPEIAEDISINDFEAFLPISDGIFITGCDPAKMLPQIAHFLCECYSSYAANFEQNCESPEDLTKIELTTLKPDGTSTTRKTYAHPILFRGGASFGNVDYMDSSYLYRNPYPHCKDHNDQGSIHLYHFVNLLGQSVLDAALFDKSELYKGTGPRFYIHDTLYDTLVARNAKKVLDFIKIETINDKNGDEVTLRYLLWPAFSMFTTNTFDQEFENFFQILNHAVRLWISYKNIDSKEAGQYLSLVEMCFDALRAFEIATMAEDEKKHKSKAVDRLGSYIDTYKYIQGASNKKVLRDILHKDLKLAGQLYK